MIHERRGARDVVMQAAVQQLPEIVADGWSVNILNEFERQPDIRGR